jgi:two-component system CitB family sensor kinase
MHTVAGLIELGDPAQALAFITEVEASSAGRVKALQERIGSPLIAALILAKQTVATERGVDLRLSPESVLDEMPAHPQTLLTVLGNLLDNAIDAAASAPPPAVVYLNLSQSASGTTVEVADTGPGIQPKTAEAIFQDGYSTKPARGHVRRGLGLALVHRVVARLGGTVTVATSPGATFTVWLPPGDGQPAHFAVTASSSVGSP